MTTNGRPPKFKSAKQLQDAIDWYFFERTHDCCGIERPVHKPITVSGMAYYLGFQHRCSITDYQNKDQFTATIKKAKLRIEQYLEEKLYGHSVAGVIFNLKNNFHWKDQVDPAVVINNNVGADPEKIMKQRGIPIPEIGIGDIDE